MDHDRFEDLLSSAKQAASNAYCAYSRFPVGAAVLTGSGQIVAGCNVENASFGLTICAERNAIHHAIVAGDRSIRLVVIYTPTPVPSAPCGACRQVIREFGPEAEVICVCDGPKVLHLACSDLLPYSFGPEALRVQPPHVQGRSASCSKAINAASSQRICVDIDNVIAQTDVVMRKLIRDYTRGRVNLRYEDIKTFNYWECQDANGCAISKTEWQAIHNIFSREENILQIEPMRGVQDCLQELGRQFSLHLATSRLPAARKATIEWLARHDFPQHDLHFLAHGEKHTSLGFFVASIEDDLMQAEGFADHGTVMSYVYAHPWNVACVSSDNLKRISGWDELVTELQDLKANRLEVESHSTAQIS